MFGLYLCMEERQGFGRVHRNEHLRQELLVFCLQRQRKSIDDAVRAEALITHTHTRSRRNEPLTALRLIKKPLRWKDCSSVAGEYGGLFSVHNLCARPRTASVLSAIRMDKCSKSFNEAVTLYINSICSDCVPNRLKGICLPDNVSHFYSFIYSFFLIFTNIMCWLYCLWCSCDAHTKRIKLN